MRLVLRFCAEPVTEQAAAGELGRARVAVEVEGKGGRSEPLPVASVVARIGVGEVPAQPTELRHIDTQGRLGHPVAAAVVDVLRFEPNFQGPAAQRTDGDREVVGAIDVPARVGAWARSGCGPR